ncbi:MAG: FtsX-like permease family protein [Clostridiales Family XIII bacterium]|jgi:putative ABC transport system permease protein|nr:FtsX-like permease family protein [Clostridiales Family XIII bacterium]
MMSIKLALRNVRKSLRDYLIYFLTLSLGVCIFYAFNSIESQQAVMEMTGSQMAALRLLSRIMNTFSVFVSVILSFLILYANGFLIKRRKKEFGLYMILGMEKWMTARILLFETLFVGVISLFAGLLLGVFLSQGMAVATARLLGAGIGSFRFVFSFSALAKTAGYFGLAFVFALLFNIEMLRRQKLIDLLYAAKKSEYFRAPRPGLSVLIFLLSLCCLGLSYKLVMANGLIASQGILTVCIVLGGAGTFLFFFSLSGFFLKLVQQSKRLYLKGLNMFILRQIASKINTAYVTMTLVCLMLFVSICTLSSGMGLADALSAELRGNTPFDATFSVRAADKSPDGAYTGVDLLAVARERGFDPGAGAYAAVRCYSADAPVVLRAEGVEKTVYPDFMKLSDFNAVLALQGIAPISLGADEYALNSGVHNEKWQRMLADYEAGGELELAGKRLRAAGDGLYAYTTEVSSIKDFTILAVVPDELLSDAPVKQDLLHINYPPGDGAYEKRCVSALLGFAPGGLEGNLETKVRLMEYSHSTTTTIAYLAIYLGVVSLLMAATVLAIGQLSEAGDNAGRYGLLRKIGVEDRMINTALFTQILICFGVPALPALVHAAVGIRAASKFVDIFGEMNILGSSLVAAFGIVTIYCMYFFATYAGSKRIVNKEYAHQRRITENE